VKKILIVEDDPVARQIMHARLKSAYQVFMSGDALAAFTEARKQQPDLIILDLGLPAGGGFTVLQRVQSLPALAGTPVLVVSGMDRAANEKKAIEAGATAYIQKPAGEEELMAKIRELIGD
jgi:DNA-binding response OmpR family regulator